MQTLPMRPKIGACRTSASSASSNCCTVARLATLSTAPMRLFSLSAALQALELLREFVAGEESALALPRKHFPVAFVGRQDALGQRE